jgi:mono/diheme cytochrome c family protein
MKFCKFCTLVVALTATGIGLGPAPAAAGELIVKERQLTWQEARLTHGEDLYVELCAVCHGQGGKGDGPAVPALQQGPPDLTTLAVRNDGVFPFEALERVVAGRTRSEAHGTVDMPIWGRAFKFTRADWNITRRDQLARHRIHNIVEYLESLQRS